MRANILVPVIMILLLMGSYYLLCRRELYSSTNIVSGNLHIIPDKLMIVAHPDDELIFGGKELLKETKWKVVCVTNGSNKSTNKITLRKSICRRNEFICAMNRLNCQYEIWDFEDNWFNTNWNNDLIIHNLNRIINERDYKMILTHNSHGEYGHLQHRKISQLVFVLKPKNLYEFSYDHDLINPYLCEIIQISNNCYPSQKHAFRKFYKYIVHQSINKINFMPG